MSDTSTLVAGTFGEKINVSVGIDLTDIDALNPAPTYTIEVKKPDDSVASWPAELLDADPALKTLTYVLQDGDVTVSGKYVLHAKVTATGLVKFGLPGVLTVKDLFDR